MIETDTTWNTDILVCKIRPASAAPFFDNKPSIRPQRLPAIPRQAVRWCAHITYLFDLLLSFPFTVVQRAHVSCLEPPGNTVEVESVLEISEMVSCPRDKQRWH